jgi:hypothetical protein
MMGKKKAAGGVPAAKTGRGHWGMANVKRLWVGR